MSVINLLVKRLDQLERDRTGFPPRGLRYGGMWLGLPVLFGLAGLCEKYGHGSLDRAGAGALWVGFVLVVTAFIWGCLVYQRRVPIRVQVAVDLIAWSILAWAFFH